MRKKGVDTAVMGRKRKIATQSEVLEFLTSVMRRTDDTSIKLSDAMSAADKLYRYLKEDAAKEESEKQSGVVILPQIASAQQDGSALTST